MIPTGRRKFFSASRAKHFFIRQPKKSLGQAGQNIPLKNGRKKFPDKQGKSFLENPEKPLLAQKNIFLQERRKNASPKRLAFLLCVC